MFLDKPIDGYVVAAYTNGMLIHEQETSSHQEALELGEELSGDYEVVIFHPDGEEEEL